MKITAVPVSNIKPGTIKDDLNCFVHCSTILCIRLIAYCRDYYQTILFPLIGRHLREIFGSRETTFSFHNNFIVI